MRVLIAGALALALLAPAAHAAEPKSEAARLTFVGYLSGLKIGWAKIEAAIVDARYAASMKMETGGMVGWFVNWRHDSRSYGGFEGGSEAKFMPRYYRNGNFWEENQRFVELDRSGGETKIKAAKPHPVEDEGHPAVPAPLLADALDPLSAILAVGREIDATGACETKLPVYDGRRLYRLEVSDDGAADLQPSRYAPLAGPSRKCDFIFKRVAGFKKKKTDKTPTEGVVYFRRAAEGAPMMPVKIVADSKYGSVMLHLKEIEPLDPLLAEQALLPAKQQ